MVTGGSQTKKVQIVWVVLQHFIKEFFTPFINKGYKLSSYKKL